MLERLQAQLDRVSQIRSTIVGAFGAAKQLARGEVEDDMQAVYDLLLNRNPPRRGTTELIRAYKRNPSFRAVVSKIADHVASVTWRVYIVKNGTGKAKQTRVGFINRPEERRKEIAGYKRKGELVEVEDHILTGLLDVANPTMSGYAARKLTQVYLDVVGEAFWVLSNNSFGAPTSYWLFPPDWIKSTPESSQQPDFELRIRGRSVYIPPEQMIWFRDLDPSDPYGRGSGLGEALGDEIDTSEYSAGYIKSFFYNRGKPDLLVSVEGANEQELKRAKEKMDQEHRGYARAHRSFWAPGKMTVKELNAKFDELQVVQLKGSLREDFVHTYGMPPEILGMLANSNRATVREALRIFNQETIVPRCERIREDLQRMIVPRLDERLIIDYDSPVPVDEESQQVAANAAPYMMTRGEWRERQGVEDRGDIDDVHMMPINLIPTDPGTETGQTMSDPKSALKSVSKTPEQDVEKVLRALEPERISEQLDPIFVDWVDEWGNDALDELGLASEFNMLNPLVVDHLKDFSENRIKGMIHGTTYEQLKSALVEGVRNGESVLELSKRVATVFDMARGYRSDRIARTEVLRSSNFATWSAHSQSGVVEGRQWIATLDAEVRDEHAALDIATRDQPVGINQPFEIDGLQAMYPGGFDDPAHDINCRCTTAAVIADPKSAEQAAAIWKAFDRKLIPWERATRAGLTRGFDTQQKEITAAVARVF